MRSAIRHGLADQTEPPQTSQIGEGLVGNLGPGVRPAALPPEQRPGAVAVADAIEHPLETALTRIGLEERGSARIAQSLVGRGPTFDVGTEGCGANAPSHFVFAR